jgi:hypothetical protein
VAAKQSGENGVPRRRAIERELAPQVSNNASAIGTQVQKVNKKIFSTHFRSAIMA